MRSIGTALALGKPGADAHGEEAKKFASKLTGQASRRRARLRRPDLIRPTRARGASHHDASFSCRRGGHDTLPAV